MFSKRIILILLIMTAIATLSTVNADEISVSDNDMLENAQELPEISTQEDVQLETVNTDQDLSAQSMNQVKENEVLGAEDSGNALSSDSTPTHVNLAASSKTVTYAKLQHIKVKVTDDEGKPVENVKIAFKIYKNDKLVDTQDDFSTGDDGYVYYSTESLNAGKYTVKYEIADKNTYQASAISSKLTVKKIKYTIKVKRHTGELDIFVKKNKKPANIKLKVKIYTGKKYKTIYLKSGHNKKLSKYKGFCAFATNDLKVGKHKVIITAANKNYQASKKTFIKVTKSIKKGRSILLLITGGKLKIYSGF